MTTPSRSEIAFGTVTSYGMGGPFFPHPSRIKNINEHSRYLFVKVDTIEFAGASFPPIAI
jgi:hypothetical protein